MESYDEFHASKGVYIPENPVKALALPQDGFPTGFRLFLLLIRQRRPLETIAAILL
jgi:hypothetical protein